MLKILTEKNCNGLGRYVKACEMLWEEISKSDSALPVKATSITKLSNILFASDIGGQTSTPLMLYYFVFIIWIPYENGLITRATGPMSRGLRHGTSWCRFAAKYSRVIKGRAKASYTTHFDTISTCTQEEYNTKCMKFTHCLK